MGPMGNYMTLLQLARGRGGYGGPQGMGGYGMPRGPMGYGGYGGGQGYGGPQPPGWLQGLSGAMGQGAPQQQGGAAPPGMGAHLSAEAKKQELMAQGMSEEQAHRAAMDTYSQMSAGAGPGVTQLTPESMGTAAAPQQAAPENDGALNAARSWASGFGQQVMPGVYGAGAMQGPQGYPGMNTAYNAMGLRGRRRFY